MFKIRPAPTHVLFFPSVLYPLFQKRPIEIYMNKIMKCTQNACFVFSICFFFYIRVQRERRDVVLLFQKSFDSPQNCYIFSGQRGIPKNKVCFIF